MLSKPFFSHKFFQFHNLLATCLHKISIIWSSTKSFFVLVKDFVIANSSGWCRKSALKLIIQFIKVEIRSDHFIISTFSDDITLFLMVFFSVLIKFENYFGLVLKRIGLQHFLWYFSNDKQILIQLSSFNLYKEMNKFILFSLMLTISFLISSRIFINSFAKFVFIYSRIFFIQLLMPFIRCIWIYYYEMCMKSVNTFTTSIYLLVHIHLLATMVSREIEPS